MSKGGDLAHDGRVLSHESAAGRGQERAERVFELVEFVASRVPGRIDGAGEMDARWDVESFSGQRAALCEDWPCPPDRPAVACPVLWPEPRTTDQNAKQFVSPVCVVRIIRQAHSAVSNSAVIRLPGIAGDVGYEVGGCRTEIQTLPAADSFVMTAFAIVAPASKSRLLAFGCFSSHG